MMTLQSRTIGIPIERGILEGELAVPAEARGIVVFAHGSGSSRHSSRNQFVAGELNGAGLATLLFDLLTEEEEAADRRTGHLRFNIPLLAERLEVATGWVVGKAEVKKLPIGLFGASTGGAAALMTAAWRPDQVRAVVSRGGRPDLAEEALERVEAPTLLIVGGNDREVIELNRAAFLRLGCEKKMEIVPGATHLFEEAGALEKVAELAAEWFGRHLSLDAGPASEAARWTQQEIERGL